MYPKVKLKSVANYQNHLNFFFELLVGLLPSQSLWLAIVIFVGEMTVLQSLLSVGIVCMTVDDKDSNKTSNLTEFQIYYSNWNAGK